MHFCYLFDRLIIIVADHWQFFSGCYIFAGCGSAAALAEIWTITIMAYERSRIICSPSSKVRLSGIQVSLLCIELNLHNEAKTFKKSTVQWCWNRGRGGKPYSNRGGADSAHPILPAHPKFFTFRHHCMLLNVISMRFSQNIFFCSV